MTKRIKLSPAAFPKLCDLLQDHVYLSNAAIEENEPGILELDLQRWHWMPGRGHSFRLKVECGSRTRFDIHFHRGFQPHGTMLTPPVYRDIEPRHIARAIIERD